MSSEDREKFTLTIDHHNGYTVARLKGRLDTYTSDQFSSRFSDLLAPAGDVILEMSELEYVSSAGLRALYNLNAELEDAGQLIFCNLHRNVDRMFEIVDVKSMFDIYDNLDSAMAALQA